MRFKLGIVLAFAAFIFYMGWFNSGGAKLDSLVANAPFFEPALQISEPPLQTTPSGVRTMYTVDDFTLTVVADFQVHARVLGKKNYRLNAEARLSPIDLALGWGDMSLSDVIERISIRQSNRWYYWRTKDFPIPRRAIEMQSANMHIIPANSAIAKHLATVKEGDEVRMLGHLVNINRSNGWYRNTSLTREDTGSGACEILLVTRLEIT